MPFFDKQLVQQVNCFVENENSTVTLYNGDFIKIALRGKLFEFLEKIGRLTNSAFRRIDCAFVPPNEHKRISEALEKQKVVFLIGDPEIGKTFTAIRILWEYHLRGFIPIWNAGGDPLERVSIRQKLSEANVQDNSITYFEDPFGKRKFEDREDLRRTISSIIKQIQMLNSKVIISSREQVFREFEAGVLSRHDFSNLIIEMNLMIPSYTDEKRTQILLNWAEEFQCKWLNDEITKNLILSEAIERLSTPLSLWDFAISSRDCTIIDEIDSLIEEKSKDIKASFAEEIAQMPRQHIVFLSLASVLANLDYDLLKHAYTRICKDLQIDQKYPLEYLEKYFSNKIVLDLRERDKKTVCHFTHPSYEEGVIDCWNRVEVQPLFFEVLDFLAHNDNSLIRGFCGLTLMKIYDGINFKEKVRKLINVIIKDKKAETRYGLVEGLKLSFRKIPIDVALEYVDLLCKDRNSEIRNQIIDLVSNNIDAIPYDKVYKILSTGLDDRAAIVRIDTVQHIRTNLEQFDMTIIEKALETTEVLCNYKGWLIHNMATTIYDDLKGKIENIKKANEG